MLGMCWWGVDRRRRCRGWTLLFAYPEPIKVIGPLLHLLQPLWQVSRPVVSPPLRIPHSVTQPLFYEVGSKTQHFTQQGPRHSTKAVHPHLIRLYVQT